MIKLEREKSQGKLHSEDVCYDYRRSRCRRRRDGVCESDVLCWVRFVGSLWKRVREREGGMSQAVQPEAGIKSNPNFPIDTQKETKIVSL